MHPPGDARHWDAVERYDFLAAARLFQGAAPETIRAVAARLHPRHVPPGAILYLEGEPAETVRILAAGQARVFRTADDGREVILRLLGPGELLGDSSVWHLPGGPAAPDLDGETDAPVFAASAVAVEDTVTLQMPSREFAALLDAHPDLGRAVIRELGRRLREAEARIHELQTERVERRIARVLLRLANKTGRKTADGIVLGVPLSRRNLAQLAGTTMTTASRTLAAWSHRGIIASGRERVTILNAHELVAIAEEFGAADE